MQNDLFRRRREAQEALEAEEEATKAATKAEEDARTRDAEDWEELFDDEQNVYYHMISTGDTSWDMPESWEGRGWSTVSS